MKLSLGEKVWCISIILFGVWVIIGNSLDIPIKTISVMGSIGMILFVAITLLSIVILKK
jgi:hypothetical protein